MLANRPRRRSFFRSLLLISAVLGPGFITASAGNDVGGIAQYSQAGAVFGYSLLWLLIPLAIALIVVQEMSTRMGCVTGKGLAALFRENFGVRISFLAMLLLFLTNTLLTATEFAGVAAASEIFGISRYIAIPIALVAVFLFVLAFNNKVVERTFVVLSLIYLTYIVSAVLAHPDWGEVARGTFVPSIHLQTAGWIAAVVGLIGTTISPYMQFFLQSAVVEKGSRAANLTFAPRSTSSPVRFWRSCLAGFMIVANAATIYLANRHGAHIGPHRPRLRRRAAAASRGVRFGALCVRNPQRGDLHGNRAASFDFLHRLRSLRVRSRDRPHVFRSAGLLHAVCRRTARGRGRRTDPARPVAQNGSVRASAPGDSAPRRARADADRHQPPSHHGQAYQLAAWKRHRVDDGGRRGRTLRAVRRGAVLPRLLGA